MAIPVPIDTLAGDPRFDEALRRLALYASSEHGVSIVPSRDLKAGFEGDIDGENVYVRDGLPDSTRLFVALHLFGHTAQWVTNERAVAIGQSILVQSGQFELSEVVSYEREAHAIGAGALIAIGRSDLLLWYQDQSSADLSRLLKAYGASDAQVGAEPRSGHQASAMPVPPFRGRPVGRSIGGRVIAFD